MFGIRKVDTTHITHREFWVICVTDSVGLVVDFAAQMIGILSFGRLTADWGLDWFSLTYEEDLHE